MSVDTLSVVRCLKRYVFETPIGTTFDTIQSRFQVGSVVVEELHKQLVSPIIYGLIVSTVDARKKDEGAFERPCHRRYIADAAETEERPAFERRAEVGVHSHVAGRIPGAAER